MRTLVLYVLFAALATAVNLLTQMLSVALVHSRHAIALSVLAGTIAGIVVKYLLDKRYIFMATFERPSQHARSAALYLAASVATTGIFWGTEALFHWIYGTDGMRYLGGALGLTIGYVTKYHLDKRLAFSERATA